MCHTLHYNTITSIDRKIHSVLNSPKPAALFMYVSVCCLNLTLDHPSHMENTWMGGESGSSRDNRRWIWILTCTGSGVSSAEGRYFKNSSEWVGWTGSRRHGRPVIEELVDSTSAGEKRGMGSKYLSLCPAVVPWAIAIHSPTHRDTEW